MSNASNKVYYSAGQNELRQSTTAQQDQALTTCSVEDHDFALSLLGLSSSSKFKQGTETLGTTKSCTKGQNEDVSNLNSRPKSVEDLLRRIGLEVRIV